MGYTEKALHGYRALRLKIRALKSGKGGWEAENRICKFKLRSQIHEHTILLRIPGIILRVSDLRFPYTIFTLQTSFKPLLLKEGGRVEINSEVEVTVNSREENS